jgi:Chalcone isomerase-like
MLSNRRVWFFIALLIISKVSMGTTSEPEAKAASTLEPSLSYLKPELDQPKLIGKGKFSFWGFDVYRAQLWSDTNIKLDNWQQNKFALELVYQRDFEGKKIAKKSIEEMTKQKDLSQQKALEWSTALEKLFPDIKKNQSLTGLYIPNYGAKFFHGSTFIGEIKDLELTKSFFDIWFSNRTTAPELRKELFKETS